MEKNNKAFTLLELIITISASAIIFVFTTILIINIINIFNKANTTSTLRNENSIIVKGIDNFFNYANKEGLDIDITINDKDFIIITDNGNYSFKYSNDDKKLIINENEFRLNYDITLNIVNNKCILIEFNNKKLAYQIYGFIKIGEN